MAASSRLAHDTSARWLLGSRHGAGCVGEARPLQPAHRWLVLAVALCVGLWAAPARADSVEARLSVKKGAELQLAVLHDGFHVGLMVDDVRPHALYQSLLPLHAEAIDVQPVGGKRCLATLRFDRPVARANASLHPVRHAPVALASPADANAAALPANVGDANHPATTLVPKAVPAGHMAVRLQVELREPREAVVEHAFSQRLPLPETLAHHRLWDAEATLMAGRLAEAQLMFEGLNPKGPLVGWVIVRQGDLAAHDGAESLACEYYARAQLLSDVRVPSTLASLRSRVLRCPKAPAADYNALLSRVGRDDAVGRNLAKEAQWALGFERDVGALDAAIGLGKRGEVLPAGLYDAVAARRLRLREPMARIVAELRQPTVAAQAEAFDLGLAIGQAWCALDVPARWQPPPLKRASWLTASAADRKRMVAAVARCQGLDSPEAALSLSRAALPQVAVTLHDVEARVREAERVAKARFGRRAGGKVASNKNKTP